MMECVAPPELRIGETLGYKYFAPLELRITEGILTTNI